MLIKTDWIEKANTYIEKCVNEDSLPTVSELASEYLECSERTVQRYMKSFYQEDNQELEEFCRTVERLMSLQKTMLIKKGLSKEWNAGIVRFLLTNNHAMTKQPDYYTQINVYDGASEGVRLLRQILKGNHVN